MGLKEFLKPRQDRFVELLIQQAEITLQGMDALESYMKKRSSKHAASVRQAEKDADEVRRILIDHLNRTFVTPIDREDIFALSRAIDDVVDYAYTTVEEMEVLDVEPNDFLRRLVSLLHGPRHWRTGWNGSTGKRSRISSRGQTTSTTSWKCSNCGNCIAT